MQNSILKILLKSSKERSIYEMCEVLKFYENCTSQEFKYAMGLEYRLKKADEQIKEEESKEEIVECFHNCSSNCRRNGCNCECGEYHE